MTDVSHVNRLALVAKLTTSLNECADRVEEYRVALATALELVGSLEGERDRARDTAVALWGELERRDAHDRWLELSPWVEEV